MIYESVRKMTVKEQMAFDMGYAKALGEIERLTAERDAALRRAEAAVRDCETCKNWATDSYHYYTYPCNECKHRARDSYEPKWRGPEPGGEGEG